MKLFGICCPSEYEFALWIILQEISQFCNKIILLIPLLILGTAVPPPDCLCLQRTFFEWRVVGIFALVGTLLKYCIVGLIIILRRVPSSVSSAEYFKCSLANRCNDWAQGKDEPCSPSQQDSQDSRRGEFVKFFSSSHLLSIVINGMKSSTVIGNGQSNTEHFVWKWGNFVNVVSVILEIAQLWTSSPSELL